jgi:1-acyl-sn-glycerol-3-phosphate acyltransferase
MASRLAIFILRIFGWRLEGQPPDIPRYVVIGAPHTSNWDFPLAILIALAYRIKIVFMMKHTMFRWPFGYFFRVLGGIPIDRRSKHNVVAQSVEAFRNSSRLIMVIPPEGTRSKTRYWKTGFYYIAHGAGVPIALAFVDFKRKVAGFGPALIPSGDILADMEIIRDFYKDKVGKNPQQFGEIAVAQPHEAASQTRHGTPGF